MKNARKILLIVATVIISILLIIKAQSAHKSTLLAADFPSGAVVFAQFSDLPGMLKNWNESELKEHYLSSTNYNEFTTRHLATKIAERFNDLGNAIGVNLDDQFLTDLSQKQAAIAVYDIGRMECVFIAPLDQEKYLLSKLVANKTHFEEILLNSGLKYYVITVDVDRNRHKQHVAFAFENGRFILATNEQLMVRTLTNVTSKPNTQMAERLISEPTYQNLINKVTPHYATIWVAQEKLNKDWYFRNYWIMKNIEDLKDIRAAVFDIQLQEKEWREERYFLTKSTIAINQISALEAQHINQLVPNTLPYFKVEPVSSSNKLSSTIHNLFFDNDLTPKKADKPSVYSNYYYYDNAQSESEAYNEDSDFYLYSNNYNKQINDAIDADDVEITPETSYINRQEVLSNIDKVFNTALPKLITSMQKPEAIDSPLFAEFHKAIIVSLQNPSQFNSLAFENSIAKLAADSTMISGNKGALSWQDTDNKQFRVLEMPMLGWRLCYRLKGQDLILSNDIGILKEILKNASSNKKLPAITTKAINDLTVIRFANREKVYDDIFNKLEEDSIKTYRKTHGGSNNAHDFFVNNISSLLDTISPVESITITRDTAQGQLHELIRIKHSSDTKTTSDTSD